MIRANVAFEGSSSLTSLSYPEKRLFLREEVFEVEAEARKVEKKRRKINLEDIFVL